MHSWTILAAKHAALTPGVALGAIPVAGWDSLDGVAVGMLVAGIGFAALSARRVPNCPLPPFGAQVVAADGVSPPARRLSRFRRRVDGVLTGMLSDDADKLHPSAAARRAGRGQAEATEPRFDGPSAWSGDYVDALPARREPDSHPYPDVPAGPPWERQPGEPGSQAGVVKPSGPAFRVSTVGAAPWPWLTSSAAVDGEQLWPLGTKPSGQPGTVDQADRRDELERALAIAHVSAAQGSDDVRPLPPPAERRRDAVQRFMAAPVIDLGMAREERARGQGQENMAGEPDQAPASHDPKAAERDRAASGRTGQASTDADDASGHGQVRWIQRSTSLSAVFPMGTSASTTPASSAGTGEVEAKPEGDGGSDAGDAGRARRDPDREVRDPGGVSRDSDADGRNRGDGRRAKPRHAAPPASLAATLSRTLSGTRLTSRSAAHAG